MNLNKRNVDIYLFSFILYMIQNIINLFKNYE